jgi:hypothetical protein
MGRGRAKAKQTKVARELKYSSGGTDLDRLAEELAKERSSSYSTSTPTPETDESAEDSDDAYDDYDNDDPDR